MKERRRAALLLGLALLLGGLAASDVAGREAALKRAVGPVVPVVVARGEIPAGARLTARRLAVRRVPARFAPRTAYGSAAALTGLRAAVAVPGGTDITTALVEDASAAARAAAGAPVRPGERVADVLAVGPPALVQPGARVDVLVTRERGTSLALEDVEVLAATPADVGSSAGAASDGAQRVEASLRVTLRQAVYLAAAQAFAREIRLLPRAAGDDRRGGAGLTVGAGLG